MNDRSADRATNDTKGDRQAREQDPAELDDPAAGNPDREPGGDDPRQRPITDNKAGG
jgi:hypothetical protein